METTKISIDKIQTAKYNPRRLTEQDKTNIQQSLQKFGFVEPLVVNKNTYTLIGGHQRYAIAKEMGYKEVPVVEVEVDEQQEKELNIRLNRNKGDWDINLLSEYFTEDELTQWGFSKEYLNGLWQIQYPEQQVDNNTNQPKEEIQQEEPPIRVVLFYEEDQYNEVTKVLNLIPGPPTEKGRVILKAMNNG